MTHSIKDKRVRDLVRNKFGGNCAYCGCVLTSLSIDHIKPKKRHLITRQGDSYNNTKCGEDTIENYNPCCKSCNSSKGSMNIEEFRQQISGRHEYMMKYFSEYRSMIKFNRISVNNEPVLFYFETVNNG